jgi:type IV secretory pathway VirB2 component (pilin)
MILLGTIAVAIVLAAGFKWMTAGGNEDKIDEAKKLMTSGVVGLIIILSAWGIATFIINQLSSATGA